MKQNPRATLIHSSDLGNIISEATGKQMTGKIKIAPIPKVAKIHMRQYSRSINEYFWNKYSEATPNIKNNKVSPLFTTSINFAEYSSDTGIYR